MILRRKHLSEFFKSFKWRLSLEIDVIEPTILDSTVNISIKISEVFEFGVILKLFGLLENMPFKCSNCSFDKELKRNSLIIISTSDWLLELDFDITFDWP